MTDFSWLTARPIAHRGLHDSKLGRIENTLSAFDAAARAGFPMEMDVHLSSDGVVYVFHDDVRDRLTTGAGPVAGRTMAELKAIPMVGTEDRIPTLREVLDLVGGPGNVQTLTHCWARLRFVLRDPALADDDAVAALDEVAIVVRQSGQFQVALRTGLLPTYDALRALLDSPAHP